MDKLRKIRRLHWKVRRNIGKTAKFWSDTYKASEDLLKVCKIWRLWGAKSSLVFNKKL